MTRTFDAPRELVFEAMTRPEHMKEWGAEGPHRCPSARSTCARAASTASSTPTPTGTSTPSGASSAKSSLRRSRLDLEFEGAPGNISVDTVTLTEEDGKTTITTTMLYPSKEARDAALQSGMKDGASVTFDRARRVPRQALMLVRPLARIPACGGADPGKGVP